MCACKSKQNKQQSENQEEVFEISVNVNNKNDLSTFHDFYYVKLETNDSCLISGVVKVIPFDNKLFILTQFGDGIVIVFDEAGKFLYKINKGRANNELMYPTDISINESSKTISILDVYRTIKTFDMDGNYINSQELNTPNMFIESIGKSMFLLFDANINKQTDYFLSFFYNGQIKQQALYKTCNDMRFLQASVFFKVNQNKVFIQHMFSDTIYNINKNDNIEPYCIIDFNGKSANKNLSEIKTTYNHYIDEVKNNNYVYRMDNFSALDNILFFTVKDNKNNYFITHNLSAKKSTVYTKLYDGLPNRYISSGRTNEYVIFCISVFELIEFFKTNEIKNDENIIKLKYECINENDNPILLFFSSPN
jgi:hypothetical protein